MTCRLLVVDDQPIVREILAAMLELEGYHVRQAGSGHEALALMAREPTDLVLLDVHMPGASGWEVLDRIRQAHPGQRVVMISDERFGADALRRGAVGFLAKPYRRSALEDAVRNALAGHEGRRGAA